MNHKISVLAIACYVAVNGVHASSPLELDATKNMTAATWSGEKTISEDKDYRVSNGLILEMGYGGDDDSSSKTFKGRSLALGIVGGTQGILSQHGGGVVNIASLILANGYYRVWSSDPNNKHKTVRGGATVISPESAPFRIYPCFDAGKTAYVVDWEMLLSGQEGTRVHVGDKELYSASTLNLRSSNPEYKGSIEVSGSNLTLSIAAEDSLGGALDGFDADALILKNNASLKPLSDGLSLEASYNRGITIDTTGGKVNVGKDQIFTVGWPVGGEGGLTKAGAGTLAVSNAMSVSVDVVEGALAAAPGIAVKLSHVRLSGGGFAVLEDSSAIELSSVDLADGCKIPVSILWDAQEYTTNDFLKVSAGVLSADDFTVLPGKGEYGAPFAKVVSAVDGDCETFSLAVLPVVKIKASVGWEVTGTNSSTWTDGKTIHEDAAYVLESTTTSVRHIYINGKAYDESLEHDYVFPGHSLTFAGIGGKDSIFRLLARSITADMRVYKEACVYMSGYGKGLTEPYERFVRGKLAVNTSSFEWHVGDRLGITKIESEITGDETAKITFVTAGGLGSGGTIVLSGVNEAYKGSMDLKPYYNQSTDSMTFRISDEINLGGNPSSFIEKALHLQSGVKFHPVGSVVIDDANRGLYFHGSRMEICVDSGDTLTLKSNMNYWDAKIKKTGGGTFNLGKMPLNSGGNELSLDAGYLQADVPDAFRYFYPITFNGGGLALEQITDPDDSRSLYGMALTNSSLAFTESSIPVKIDCGGDRPGSDVLVPLFIVREKYADDMASRLSFEKIGTVGQWIPVRKNVNVNGIDCTLFSARYEVGFCIMLR